jgi:hypothetical protein
MDQLAELRSQQQQSYESFINSNCSGNMNDMKSGGKNNVNSDDTLICPGCWHIVKKNSIVEESAVCRQCHIR